MKSKENSGVLFKNDRREKETHPQLKGSINVEGRDYWLSAWTKKNDDGSFKLISLSLQPKEERNHQADRKKAFGGEQPRRGQQAPQANKWDSEFESDDIPF